MAYSEGFEWVIIIFVGLIIGLLSLHLSNFISKFLPYSIFLMLVGFSIGLISSFIDSNITVVESVTKINPHMFLQIFLPNLIFYSVFTINYHTLFRVFWPAIILAGPGVILNTLLTSVIMLPYKWSWTTCLLLGAIISATDPVAVVTLLREIKASQNLAILIESESLFNDSSAIVLFVVLSTMISDTNKVNGTLFYFKQITLLLTAPLFGLVFGAVIIIWISLINGNELVETTLTFVGSNLVFFVAEICNSSGVLATVCMGLLLVRFKSLFNPKSLQNLEHFWEFLEYFAKTLIFLLSGIIVSTKILHLKAISLNDIFYVFVIYGWINVTRAVVLLCCYPFLKLFDKEIDWKTMIVVWYGSLRGAIGLALAMITEHIEEIPIETRELIMFQVCSIVTLTLLINGTTIKYILNFLKIRGKIYRSDFMIQHSLIHLKNKSTLLCDVLTQNNHFSGANWIKVKELMPNYFKLLKTNKYKQQTELDQCKDSIRYRFICSMKSFYWKQHFDGMITTHAYNILNDAAEDSIEKNNIFSQWESIRDHFKIPHFLNSLIKFKIFRPLIVRYLNQRIFLSVQLSTSFIFAIDRTGIIVNSFPEWHNKNLKEIEMELQNVEKKAYVELHNIQKMYPEVYQAIQTRNAFAFILNKDTRNIHRMKKDGIIQNTECEEMIEHIEKTRRKMKILNMVSNNVDTFTAFKNLPFISPLSSSLVHKLFSKTHYKIYSEDSVLYNIRQIKKSFFVIIRGLVEVISENEVKTVYGPGSILNLWSTISANSSISSGKCLTTVTMLKISSELCSEIMENKNSERIIWKCAGFMLMKNLFSNCFDFDIDNVKLGKICISSSLIKSKERKIEYSSMILLLKGQLLVNSKIYTAPDIIKSKKQFLKGKKKYKNHFNSEATLINGVVLLMDGNGGKFGQSISEIANTSSTKENSFNREQSLGMIYVKGSIESNRVGLKKK